GTVDARLGTIERAYLAPNLALTLGLRGLRDGIDNAAQLGLAVEYRRRTFQHFDTFECINLGARTVVVTEDRAQSILIGGDIEPAHRHPVPARIEPIIAGVNPRRVQQRILDILGAAVANEFFANHRYRCRRLVRADIQFAGLCRSAHV